MLFTARVKPHLSAAHAIVAHSYAAPRIQPVHCLMLQQRHCCLGASTICDWWVGLTTLPRINGSAFRRRTTTTALAGITAGILGLQGFMGFGFYLLVGLLVTVSTSFLALITPVTPAA